MAIALAPQFTQRSYRWSDWKMVRALKRLQTQYDDDGVMYTVFGYDGPEVHVCTIWKGTVPDGVQDGGYSQAQNDTDKADFEANHKPGANQPVSPKTSDGKNIYLPNLFPGNVMLYICGCGDSSTVIGAGTDFKLSATNNTTTLDFQFRDWVYLAGGGIFYENASSDEMSMKLYAPASTVSASSGGNTGNCNLVAIGGGVNMIVPAAGNGTHNLTAGVPVPAYDDENGETPDGYWDWNSPDTGSGTITANPGLGGYLLFDQPIDLAYFVRKLQLVGNGADGNFDITVPAIKPKKILPQWKFQVSLTSSSLHTVKTGWYLVTARRKTA